MASIRIGFLFTDSSFFNCEVDATEIGPLYGGNGNWRASVLAGNMASQKGIQPTSVDLKNFQIGGHHADKVEDDVLYQIQEMNEEMDIRKNSMTDTNKEATSIEQSDERHHWSHEGILLLLELYMLNNSSFHSPQITKRQAWKKVAIAMTEKGYSLSGENCEKKFNNMKLRYKTIVDNNNSTGRSHKKWQYFSNMEEILCKDPSVEPPVTISSLSGTRVSRPKRKLFEDTTATNITPPPSMIEEPSIKKKLRKSDKENEAPSWFQEWATTNQQIMKELCQQTKRKNDLLEKLLEKL